MNENFLQYIWQYKLLSRFLFYVEGDEIEILDFGQLNHNAGPDFLMGKVRINENIMVGNIELHVNTSDWKSHNHSQNKEYHNIILQVVYEHDCDISLLTEKNIPTLEIKNYILPEIASKINVIEKNYHFIPCEKIFDYKKIPDSFAEQSLLEKLNAKNDFITDSLKMTNNSYEATLFHLLAYSFGLKINAEIFLQLSQTIDFSIIQKVRKNLIPLEALFFGMSGWLEDTVDEQTTIWKQEFEFIKSKFELPFVSFSPKFSKLRPNNFPTIRLSQLAVLYHTKSNLFSLIIEANSIEEYVSIFKDITASEYWNDHYIFGKKSKAFSEKKLSMEFINLLITNVVLPLKYAYYQETQSTKENNIIYHYKTVKPEKNRIIEQWKKLHIPFTNALQSQAFLYHYKTFCQRKKCLNCSIGNQLLQNVE